jgi:hypothetical protein
VDELSGRAIEVRGVVRGMMSGVRGRVCLLQMADAILPLTAPPTVITPELKPNAKLRILALVNANDVEGPLTILSFSTAPDSAFVSAQVAPDAAIVPDGAQNRIVTVVGRPQRAATTW